MGQNTNINECCACQGMGWFVEEDECRPCEAHFCGQLHPFSRSLLLDDLSSLKEEERKSKLRWQIAQKQKRILDIKSELIRLGSEISDLENKLYTATPTTKMQKPIFDKLMLDIKHLP